MSLLPGHLLPSALGGHSVWCPHRPGRDCSHPTPLPFQLIHAGQSPAAHTRSALLRAGMYSNISRGLNQPLHKTPQDSQGDRQIQSDGCDHSALSLTCLLMSPLCHHYMTSIPTSASNSVHRSFSFNAVYSGSVHINRTERGVPSSCPYCVYSDPFPPSAF